MSNSGIETMQVVILILVAIALLANVGLIVAIFVGMGKMAKTMKDEIADLRASVMPMIQETRELLTKVSPKIESTVDDVSVILHGVRSQTSAFESVSSDVVARLRRQAARLEGLFSNLVDTADRTGTVVSDTVGRPVRQLAGILASARAVVETLRSPGPARRASREEDGRDMFV